MEDSKIFEVIKNAQSATDRQRFANEIFRNLDTTDVIRNISELSHGTLVYAILQNALEVDSPTVDTLYRLIDDTEIIHSVTFRYDMVHLSDTILLAKFATENIPENIDVFERIYITYVTLERASNNEAYLVLPLESALNVIISHTWPQQGTGSHIQSVGWGDLLVVKQHIVRYEATEIAHIENIMAGESRTREHRFLDRFEETLSFETETTTEQEKELQTTERFEMNREASLTIKEDQKYGANLSISASYGPTVQVNAGFEMEISRSQESTSKSSSTYARDVMERSLERIKERVKEERIRKIIRETEEKNTHIFVNTNTPSEHISGIYQFVDKIYKAQVFKYGKRKMFDLMIPEPASFLWHLENNAPGEGPNSVTMPKKFDIDPFHLTYEKINDDPRTPLPENFYTTFVNLYGATDVTPPPKKMSVNFKHQEPSSSTPGSPGTSWVDEVGEHKRMRIIEITIPVDYIPKSAVLNAYTGSDVGEHVRVDFYFGQVYDRLLGTEMERVEIGGPMAHMRWGRKEILFGPEEINKLNVLDQQGKLFLSLFVFDSANHMITGKVECEPSQNLIQKWQLETYKKIRSAYEDRMLEYRDEQSKIKAEQKAQEAQQNRVIGIPPGKRKQVLLNELKKHAISIFTNNHIFNTAWQGNNPMREGTAESPEIPRFDIDRAKSQGDFIRFFENAFEWDQIQYAFYPYFWHTDNKKWAERFLKDDPDYEFQQFLQAGAARVVLPARLGFEDAIAHYLESGEIWNGVGAPPKLEDPLYVSIIQEIRESTGGRLNEPEPVGEPWEVRLPTNLILLKTNSDLPAWRELEEGSWEWVPEVD